MNVLHVIGRYPPAIGGAEAWCAGLVRGLAARGHANHVLALRVIEEDALWGAAVGDGPSPIAIGELDLGDSVVVERCEPSRTPWGVVRVAERCGVPILGRFSVAMASRIVAAVRRASVVHLHQANVTTSWLGYAAARWVGRPVVVTPHLHPDDPHVEHRAVRALLRGADRVIAVTPREVDALVARGVARERIAVSANAVDPSAFVVADATVRERVRQAWGAGPTTTVVLYVGRKAEQKSLPVLIDAMVSLASTRDVVLVLAGPTTAWHREHAAAWARLPVRVVDLPPVPQEAMGVLHAAADLLVQPSVFEAFGIVFLEAWAAGRPVIGARAGAIPDVIADAGQTFTPGDAADLARCIGWTIDHPAEAAAQAERGRARVERDYGWDRVAAPVEAAYREVAS